MSAAPAMTRQNARKRAVMPAGPEPIGSWNTMMPPMIAARLAATEVSAIISTPLPIWRLVEGDHAGDHRGECPRAQQPEQRSWLRFGDVLDRDGGHPEKRAGGRTEEQSLGASAGQSDDHQPCRGDRHADPLSSSELKAEESLREHREEDEPAGEDRLHDR